MKCGSCLLIHFVKFVFLFCFINVYSLGAFRSEVESEQLMVIYPYPESKSYTKILEGTKRFCAFVKNMNLLKLDFVLFCCFTVVAIFSW